MPNWCCNTITINGDSNALAKFKTYLKSTNFPPKPNFFFRWDINKEDDINFYTDKIVIKCNTSWQPATEWAYNKSIKFSGIKIKVAYFEGGQGYYGIISYINGDEIKSECKYHLINYNDKNDVTYHTVRGCVYSEHIEQFRDEHNIDGYGG